MSLFLLPFHFSPRLIRHDQTERLSKAPRITTPGQIWRIEVRILLGHRAWLCRPGCTEAGRLTVFHPALLQVAPGAIIPCPILRHHPPPAPSFPRPPHIHPPGWFFCALFLALPFPTLRLVKGRHGSWGSWVVKPSDFRSLLRAMQMVPCSFQLFGSFFDGDCYVILAVSGEWAGEGRSRRAKLGQQQEEP